MRLAVFSSSVMGFAMAEAGASFVEMLIVIGFVEGLWCAVDAVHRWRHRPPRRCRSCGCTVSQACVKPYETALGTMYSSCAWLERELCSACGPTAGEGWIHPERPEMTLR